MPQFKSLSKPKIDIENFGMGANISPINQVRMMDEDSFEHFTVEWLYTCKRNMYTSIRKIGGAGDKGRDVIGYYNNGTVDYYQCKHYASALMPSHYYIELGKLCYFTFSKEYAIPKNYYIVASNDIGPTLNRLIENPNELRSELKINWDGYCKNAITKTNEIALNGVFEKYVDSFDFSIIHHCPIQSVIDDHIRTIYGTIRFGGVSVKIPDKVDPPEALDSDELIYVIELLKVYAEALGIDELPMDMLEKYAKYNQNFERQRKDYYSAETIRRFVRDVFTDSKQFEVLKDETYDGIIEVHEAEYPNGFGRLNAVTKHASMVTTDKSLLSSKLHCIGNSEKKGVCHILVNDGRLKWVNNDD
ncbi:MAG TPA: hypothetical protein DDW65_10925 [Firmicutes bacterium]|nr:hypothetical protein [Bacillota bacterium]